MIAGSALMALGGASLSLLAGSFSPGMVNGRGFICLALTTLAGWRTGLILILALLIGAIDAYQLRAQKEFALAPQIFLMVPFVAPDHRAGVDPDLTPPARPARPLCERPRP